MPSKTEAICSILFVIWIAILTIMFCFLSLSGIPDPASGSISRDLTF